MSGHAVRIAAAPPSVAGRYLFYNRSAFDGDSPLADFQDDAAVATDKQGYRPAAGGAPRFANVSSYSRGSNGVMVDGAGQFGRTPALTDFEFRTGSGANPAAWPLAPAPAMTVRRGAGVGDSDRFTFVWPDNAVRNTWLRVTVKATAGTGLSAPDVFYFGHLAGESGDGSTRSGAVVNAIDQARTRSAIALAKGSAPVTNPFDFNRDGRVNAVDLTIARGGEHAALPWLTASTAGARSYAPPAEAARATPKRRTGLLLDESQA
jgi:hypothetical protein